MRSRRSRNSTHHELPVRVPHFVRIHHLVPPTNLKDPLEERLQLGKVPLLNQLLPPGERTSEQASKRANEQSASEGVRRGERDPRPHVKRGRDQYPPLEILRHNEPTQDRTEILHLRCHPPTLAPIRQNVHLVRILTHVQRPLQQPKQPPLVMLQTNRNIPRPLQNRRLRCQHLAFRKAPVLFLHRLFFHRHVATVLVQLALGPIHRDPIRTTPHVHHVLLGNQLGPQTRLRGVPSQLLPNLGERANERTSDARCVARVR